MLPKGRQLDAMPSRGRTEEFESHFLSGEMVWGRRRDFLPGSQEVKWRDGNPPTNAIVPLHRERWIRQLMAHLARLGCSRSVMVLGAVKGRAQARPASGFIP